MSNRELLEKANQLSYNGQNEMADPIFDKLIELESTNDEFIFCKAMNVADSNPALSISLLKKVLMLNPNVIAAYTNISAIANKYNLLDETIPFFNEKLKEFPNLLDLYMYRGSLIGNKGNYIDALIDFYYVIDNSNLGNNKEEFSSHQISKDIAVSRNELKNKFLNAPITEFNIEENGKPIKIKEYTYPLPGNLFGTERSYFEFGKFMGHTIKYVINNEPSYLLWCIENLKNFCVSEEILEIIKRKGLDISRSIEINNKKLKLCAMQQIEISEEDIYKIFEMQQAIKLYRKWYLISKKDSSQQYDKDQIDDLMDFLMIQSEPVRNYFLSQNIDSYRTEIPMLYVRGKEIKTFPHELMVIKNSIQSLNMPGCIATGKDINEAYRNYFRALIECTDTRYQNGLGLMNIVHTMNIYNLNSKDMSRNELTKELKDSGWTQEYQGVYNTILFHPKSKITYTIPKHEIIEEGIIFWFRKLQYQIDAKTHRELYTDIPDNSFWTCPICGGSNLSGCQYFDPTECPR